MPPRHCPPAALRGRVFTRAEGLALVSRHDLAGPAYRRLARGVYVESGLDIPEDVARLLALRAVMPPEAVFAGPSAARALGSRWDWPERHVEVVLPRGRRVRPRRELVVRGDALAAGEIVQTPSVR